MLMLIETVNGNRLVHAISPQTIQDENGESRLETAAEAAERAAEWFASKGRTVVVADVPKLASREDRDAWVSEYLSRQKV